MDTAALEALERTTDIFETSPWGPAASGAGTGARGEYSAGTGARGDHITLRRGFHPPLPIATEATGLPASFRTLLWGWNLLRALAQDGVTEVETRRFEGDAEEAILLILSLENRPGDYTLSEQSRILALCEEAGVEPTEEITRLVTGGRPFAEQARRFAALPVALKAPVAAEQLDLKTAERWAGLPRAAAALLERTRGLSFSNRRRFFTMMWEVAQRDGLSEAALEDRARAIAEATDPIAAVERLRYPKLSGLEERFEEIKRRTLSGSGVRLSAPSYFEGGSFTVEFSFRSKAELDSRMKAVSRLEDVTDELFELL